MLRFWIPHRRTSCSIVLRQGAGFFKLREAGLRRWGIRSRLELRDVPSIRKKWLTPLSNFAVMTIWPTSLEGMQHLLPSGPLRDPGWPTICWITFCVYLNDQGIAHRREWISWQGYLRSSGRERMERDDTGEIRVERYRSGFVAGDSGHSQTCRLSRPLRRQGTRCP